jgi:micrococcal nuclease
VQLIVAGAALVVVASPFTSEADQTIAADRMTTTDGPTTTLEVVGDVATTLAVTTTVAPPTTSLVPPGVPAGQDTAVVRIVDGDTIIVTGGTRVRLIGVDTPETVDPASPVQCFGPEATRYATELLPVGTGVRLVYDVERLDRFGRTLAYVYKLTDGVFVNLAMARSGFALQLTVPPNVAHAEQFRAAVAEARTASRGLWQACPSATAPATATAPVTAAPTTRAVPPPAPPASSPTTVFSPTTVRPPTTAAAPAGGCHASYAGACVPTGFSDVDCAGGSGNGPGYVSAKNFRVVGPDVYGLDADGDGVACESR